MITVKFGGTSLADASRYRHAAQIIREDPRRRFVVVSAPGKRHPEDIKITDLLYCGEFDQIEERFREIIRELELDLDLSRDFAEIRQEPRQKAYLASRGEYLSAKIMAAYLGWSFVDAASCVFFDEHGALDAHKTESSLFEALKELPCAVLPGFYGVKPDGTIHTFSRGGSDVTGALVARAMECTVYENWTDVDGMLVTDPRIVPEAASIGTITYSELRELAYQGAAVLHEDSVLPVRETGIPIHICNTFHPQGAGSWIGAQIREAPGLITGIAGRKGYSTILIERENTNEIVGYARRILSCLERLGIPFDHMATGLGSVSLVVPSAALAGCREQLERDIRRAVQPDSIRISEGLAMIAVVGRGMVNHPGVSAKLFAAVGEAGINVRIIDQGSGEMNIVIGVDENQYEKAVQAIYHKFFD